MYTSLLEYRQLHVLKRAAIAFASQCVDVSYAGHMSCLELSLNAGGHNTATSLKSISPLRDITVLSMAGKLSLPNFLYLLQVSGNYCDT